MTCLGKILRVEGDIHKSATIWIRLSLAIVNYPYSNRANKSINSKILANCIYTINGVGDAIQEIKDERYRHVFGDYYTTPIRWGHTRVYDRVKAEHVSFRILYNFKKMRFYMEITDCVSNKTAKYEEPNKDIYDNSIDWVQTKNKYREKKFRCRNKSQKISEYKKNKRY